MFLEDETSFERTVGKIFLNTWLSKSSKTCDCCKFSKYYLV
jgi:hypothetical protein